MSFIGMAFEKDCHPQGMDGYTRQNGNQRGCAE